jgi:hypothetical protein
VAQSSSTPLGRAQINGAEILIELAEPSGHPAVIRIGWPPQASLIPPTRFNAVAGDLTRLFASASVRLTQIRAQR